MTPGRVAVVGLGPAGADLLLPRGRRAIEAAPPAGRFARTARHPAVDDLAADGITFQTFDALYESAPRIEDVYPAIVAALVEAAAEGDVVYAVPGSPVVAERSVALLLGSDVEVELVPGLSFVDLAWARLGVDPLTGAMAVDGRDLGAVGAGPLLIAQCDSKLVLSDVKLALLERYRPETPVVVLQRLGLPDECITTVPVAELDREVEPDHLTSLYVEAGDGEGAAAAEEFTRFVALVERLRGPGGCPWDAEQTHQSLTRHLIEEAYEVVEVLEATPTDYAKLEEELGDLAFQIAFHATLAKEQDAFTMAEVLRGIREKLVRRHPHVFGDVEADDADTVVRNWEQIKRAEKGDVAASLMEDVPSHLPSLLYAHKLFRKAAAGNLDLMSEEEAAAAVSDAVARLAKAEGPEAEELAGEALAALVLLARRRGFDAESALRGWAGRFRSRFLAVEALAAERGVDLGAADPAEVSALWIESGMI